MTDKVPAVESAGIFFDRFALYLLQAGSPHPRSLFEEQGVPGSG